MPDSPQAPIRLNLGCGEMILPGYTNVDIVESRSGKRPDLICDITDLSPFADNSVDEILTVHVIEHFYLWRLPAVLSEWRRVLKPGGVLVTETPNLLFACQQIVANPELATLPDSQFSMWVLFGNPNEQDELMCHHWCFTPQSLSHLLGVNGFVNVREEPAQYKKREPRDFRIVCEKPA